MSTDPGMLRDEISASWDRWEHRAVQERPTVLSAAPKCTHTASSSFLPSAPRANYLEICENKAKQLIRSAPVQYLQLTGRSSDGKIPSEVEVSLCYKLSGVEWMGDTP